VLGHVIGHQVIECPARPTAVIRGTVARSRLDSFMTGALRFVLAAMEAQGTIPGGEPFAVYHAIKGAALYVEVGFPTIGEFAPSGDVARGQLPGGKTLTAVHVGLHDALGDTDADMRAWAVAHGLQPAGAMWEVYLTDPEREADASQQRVGVFLPLK
jgi:effector-binding domain-containing protein